MFCGSNTNYKLHDQDLSKFSGACVGVYSFGVNSGPFSDVTESGVNTCIFAAAGDAFFWSLILLETLNYFISRSDFENKTDTKIINQISEMIDKLEYPEK